MRMTFGDLILAVARMSDDTTNVGKAVCARRINDIQEKIARRHIWAFFKEQSSSIALTAGTIDYSLPATFRDLTYVWYRGTAEEVCHLDPASDATFFERIITGNEAYYDSPRLYRLLGMDDNRRLKLQVGPPPSAAHISTYGATLYVEICKKPTVLQNTTADKAKYLDWPDEHYTAIEFGAAGLVCAGQGDVTKGQGFLGIYERELKELIADDVMRHGKVDPIKPSAVCTPYPWRAGRGRRIRLR